MKDFAKSIVCNTKSEVAKVRNATIKFYGETIDLTKKSESDLKEILEELQMMHEQSDAQRAIKEELNKRKTGNSKVGNADKFSGNYIIMSDDGNVWFRDEHEDVSIRSIDSWAQKRIAEYQRSINEIQKGVQEAKQAAKKFGLL